ncbi:hypothetical protein PR048_031607 [Dryococelus australis]|uniref:Uncharacterized protein n=1 Tax=Dryococelus australis TaxID=614101 RepID=A0ABQ9G5R3_9NEOP|nr:hypothetical protein PR048_031607 [Dryococelus australis]
MWGVYTDTRQHSVLVGLASSSLSSPLMLWNSITSSTLAGSPDFRKWESCRTMPSVGGFSRGSPVSPVPSFRCRSIFTSITIIGSLDLAVKSRPNLFTRLLHSPSVKRREQILCIACREKGVRLGHLSPCVRTTCSAFLPHSPYIKRGTILSSFENIVACVQPHAAIPLTITGYEYWCCAAIRKPSRCEELRRITPPSPRLREQGSIPGEVAPEFSQVGIVLDDAAVGGLSRGSPVPPLLHSGAAPYSPHFTLKTSMNKIWIEKGRDGEHIKDYTTNSTNRVGGITLGFSHLEIVPDNGAGRRVFSGISRFPHQCILVLFYADLASTPLAQFSPCPLPMRVIEVRKHANKQQSPERSPRTNVWERPHRESMGGRRAV